MHIKGLTHPSRFLLDSREHFNVFKTREISKLDCVVGGVRRAKWSPKCNRKRWLIGETPRTQFSPLPPSPPGIYLNDNRVPCSKIYKMLPRYKSPKGNLRIGRKFPFVRQFELEWLSKFARWPWRRLSTLRATRYTIYVMRIIYARHMC